MKAIETKDDFVRWAKQVNESTSVKISNNLQDTFGHSNLSTLKKIYVSDLNGDRNLITFAISKNQSYDTLFDFLGDWSHHRALDVIEKETLDVHEQYQKNYVELAKQRTIFHGCKKTVYKRIRQWRELVTSRNIDIEGLKSKVSRLQTENMQLHEANRRLLKQADNFETIKRILN